jgi:signal transduction histidine kinase
MNKRLLVIFILLILAPVSVITWMGFAGYQREKATVSDRYRTLAQNQLVEIDRLILSRIEAIESELAETLSVYTANFDELRRITRTSDIIKQIFIIDDDGSYVFPPENGEKSQRESDFLVEAKEIELALVIGGNARDVSSERLETYGWHTWFMGDGINFVFWHTSAEDFRVGMYVDRIALISKIIAILPDSDFVDEVDESSRIAVIDARGEVLYQWGLFNPAVEQMPVADIALSDPLGAWHFRYYLDLEADRVQNAIGRYAMVLPGIVALIVMLAFLAFYFFRENTKVIRDALQKVSFVNQVSHELRTPLTNIRLYAELLESSVTGDAAKTQLSIITSESQRLGRMINNVLAFSQWGAAGFETHPAAVIVDDVVRKVIDSFALALEAKEFHLVHSYNAAVEIRSDGDFIEQILANLIGNAEKYASAGRYLKVSTEQDDAITSIRVGDHGPGIPTGERKKIFRPFYRISNKLTDGVAGAGIGLALSRKLAECLGGDLVVEDGAAGATFRLDIANMILEKR